MFEAVVTTFSHSQAYSAVPSVLDYTTGVVPVTFADQYLDYGPFRYTPMSDKDRINWNLCKW